MVSIPIPYDLINKIIFYRFPAKVNLHSPNLPTKYPDQEREQYKATRHKIDDHNNLLAYNQKH